ISKEKTSIAEKSSRERISARTSFQTTAETALKKLDEGRRASFSRGLASAWMDSSTTGVNLSVKSACQCLLIEREQVAVLQLAARRRSADHATSQDIEASRQLLG